ELTGLLPRSGRAASTAAAVLAPAMTTYTAVLLADTAVPGWHESYRELPFVFAGSAVSSAGAVGMLAAPGESAPARRMAIAGAALELVAFSRMHRSAGIVGEVYRQGRAGTVLRAARVLACIGLGAAALSGRSRAARITSGLCLNAAAAATRYGIFEAGRASARDPRYIVLPQHAD
ncbi:polysulfide reductase, partial [Saccharopolyspora sp. NPDC002686]